MPTKAIDQNVIWYERMLSNDRILVESIVLVEPSPRVDDLERLKGRDAVSEGLPDVLFKETVVNVEVVRIGIAVGIRRPSAKKVSALTFWPVVLAIPSN